MADAVAPSPSLLIKLLKMTTSSNDSEALVAMRKANREAAKFGGWDAVMAGKITVIGDPFASVAAPPERASNGHKPVPPARPNAPTPRAAPNRYGAPPPHTPRSAPDSSFPVNAIVGDLHTWRGDRWIYMTSGWQNIGPASANASVRGTPSPRRGTVKIDDLV